MTGTERKELRKIMLECHARMLALGIPVFNAKKITVGVRDFKSRLGECEVFFTSSEMDEIARCKIYMDKNWTKDTSRRFIKSIMFHELAHTCPDASDHNSEMFKHCVEIIREKLGIDILATTDGFAFCQMPLLGEIRCLGCGGKTEVHNPETLRHDLMAAILNGNTCCIYCGADIKYVSASVNNIA